MCGICGIAGPGADRALVERMNASLAHRGPDGEGFYADDGIVLGHRRLRIIEGHLAKNIGERQPWEYLRVQTEQVA